MSVKITNQTYLNGMPIPEEYTIEINGIKIKLKPEDFNELLKEMDKKVHKNFEKTKELKEKYDEKVKIFQNFKNEIIRVFWEGDPGDMDSWFIPKRPKEVDEKQLDDILNKYSKMLGFS